MKAYISATPLFKAYDEKTKEIRDVVCIDIKKMGGNSNETTKRN